MQNFNNHTRYFPLHHFIITPLTLIYFFWTCYKIFLEWSAVSWQTHTYNLIPAIVLVLIPILSRVYALKNQDRIIRLEMRQRYFELSGSAFREKERKLRLSQIVALRFASDEELVPLVNRTIKESMRSQEIKKSIKNWQEDKRRV